jgi:hypothetical protein
MIKQLLGCRHLLSHKPNGVTIQIYLAIIACIMIMSIKGKSPTKRTYEMISFYLAGWATRDELEEHIKKLPDQVVNLAFEDNAKTVPNTIGWKPIPRALLPCVRWFHSSLVTRDSPQASS